MKTIHQPLFKLIGSILKVGGKLFNFITFVSKKL